MISVLSYKYSTLTEAGWIHSEWSESQSVEGESAQTDQNDLLTLRLDSCEDENSGSLWTRVRRVWLSPDTQKVKDKLAEFGAEFCYQNNLSGREYIFNDDNRESLLPFLVQKMMGGCDKQDEELLSKFGQKHWKKKEIEYWDRIHSLEKQVCALEKEKREIIERIEKPLFWAVKTVMHRLNPLLYRSN